MRRSLWRKVLKVGIVFPLLLLALASCGGGGGEGGGLSLRRGAELGEEEGAGAPAPRTGGAPGPGGAPTTGPGGPAGPGGEMPGMMGGPEGMPGMMGAPQQKQAEKPKRKKVAPPLYRAAEDPFLPPMAPLKKERPVKEEGPVVRREEVRRPELLQPLQIPPLAISPPSYMPTGLSLKGPRRPARPPRVAPEAAPAVPPTGARVSSIASNDMVMAIVEVGGKSIVVKPGDPLDPVIEGAYVERIEPTGVVVRKGEETFTIPLRGG